MRAHRDRLRRPALATLLTAALVLGGCDAAPGGAEGTATTARDSAGVRIVESSRPAHSGWSVEPEPYLSIGSVDGDEPYLLSRVGGVRIADDGRVVLLNGSDQTVRVYGADGRYLARMGGAGDGPGEFTAPGARGIFVQGGQVLVPHGGAGVFLERFDLDGRLLGSVRVHDVPVYGLSAVEVLVDGRVVLASFPQGGRAGGTSGIVIQPRTVHLLDPDDVRVDSVTSIEGLRFLDVGLSVLINQEFGPIGQVAAHGEEILVGWPERAEVRAVDPAGALRRIQRWALPAAAVTEAQRQAYRDRLLTMGTESGGQASDALRQQRRTMVDGMVFPTEHRVYTRLLPDAAGNLWVQRFDVRSAGTPEERAEAFASPAVWDVLDPTGAWVTTVETPGGVGVSSIGADHVAGVSRDEMGVEYVVLHRLIRGGPG